MAKHDHWLGCGSNGEVERWKRIENRQVTGPLKVLGLGSPGGQSPWGAEAWGGADHWSFLLLDVHFNRLPVVQIMNVALFLGRMPQNLARLTLPQTFCF